MPRISPIFATFNAGEWSPSLYGRVDLPKYQNACRTLLNFIPLPQGAATRRPGTRFVALAKNMGPMRLIPFEYSTTQAYMIEAGGNYFRFYKDRGRIEAMPGIPVEIATPYKAEHLAGLKWAQSADVLYLCHPLYQPHKLSRLSHTNWQLTPLESSDGPYMEINISDTTLQPAATSGTTTITATNDVFVPTDVGRMVRLQHADIWGWAKITAVSSTKVVTATVKSNFNAATATKNWRLGAWDQGNGWPSCVTFYEERLFFAGTRKQPQTLWASMAGDYENFAPSTRDSKVLADNSLNFTISDDRVNAIRWLSAGKTLAVGTVGGEFSVRASTLNEALTPDNITVRRESTVGSADQMAVRINQAVLFVQRAGRKLYESAYSLDSDGLAAPEMTLLSRHLTQGGITEIAFQQEPWAVLWVTLADGGLLGLTYLREQEVVGWHRHGLGGQDVRVISIATIAGISQDELWLAVKRGVGGEGQQMIEVMESEFLPNHSTDTKSAFFVDCGLTYDGVATLRIRGLDHLIGQKVQILADGGTHPDKTVEPGGQVTLDRPARLIHIGLPYESVLETLDLEAGSAEGSAQGKPKRITRATVKLLDSLGGSLGFDPHYLEDIPFRDSGMPMDQSPPLFSGDKRVVFPKGWDRVARLMVRQRQPLPMTILAIVPQITTMDG
jgi:hypothetical protein